MSGPSNDFVVRGLHWDRLPACTLALMSMLALIALKGD